MPDFEHTFESSRLAMLAEQFPNVAKPAGRVSFSINERGRLDGTSWDLEDSIQAQISESGFKSRFLELLESLILYRRQHDRLPGRAGIAHIGGGSIEIEWLAEEPADT